MHFCRYTRRDRSFGGEFFVCLLVSLILSLKWRPLLLSCRHLSEPLFLCFATLGGGGGRWSGSSEGLEAPATLPGSSLGPRSQPRRPVPPQYRRRPALTTWDRLDRRLPGSPHPSRNAGKPAPGTSLRQSSHLRSFLCLLFPPPLPIPACRKSNLAFGFDADAYLTQAD